VIKLVVFDLDGTLVDSLPDIARALNHALGERGLAPLGRDVVRGLVGEGVVRLAEKALAAQPVTATTPAPGVAAAAVAESVRAFYAAHACVDSALYPGIAEALATASGGGSRRIAVLTNKPGEVARALLAALGIADRCDAIVGDGDGFPRKPAPEAATALMARFRAGPGETLMVGDGLPDMALARAAGCPAAAALWGYTPRALLEAEAPRFLLETPADLGRILLGDPLP
jgi:phosphoglycolate phosphatase